jgi:GntR family transcriptional regulator
VSRGQSEDRSLLAAHTGDVEEETDVRIPLWAQVLADLRARLDAGEFSKRFPGDAELVERYHVSRHTAREAVRRLQAEGVLERQRGRGSFVTAPRIEQPIGTLYSLYRSVEELGLAQESLVRHLEVRHDDKAAAMLGCSGEPLVFLERLRLADGEPIALDCSWLPAGLARPLLEVDFRHTALYEELTERCGIRLTSGWERIRPVMPDRTQRELLQVDSRQPAFAIERLALVDGRPVEWRHGVVRGDRFSFVARWSSTKLDSGFEPTSNGLS